MKSCYLEEKFRQEDNRLIKVLDDIRSGTVDSSTYEILESRFNVELKDGFTPTRLYTHNIDVDRINNIGVGEAQREKENFYL